jgi:predicted nucleic acid-binding protein
MTDTVVDSSVVAKWILPEADRAQADRLIDEVALIGQRLIALDLAFVEVANAIWKRHHRGLATLFVALCQDLGLQGVTADEPLYNATHLDYPRIILLRNW